MASISHTLPLPAPFVRSFAVAALMSATILASPLSARADTVGNAAFQLAQAAAPKTQAGVAATQSKGETVEQRIAKWEAVAQAMRENASNMDKLVAEGRTTAPQNMTAIEDLEMYQKFAQAHVDGLKNLISSFSTLYSAMPDAQKKNADSVFEAAQQNRQTAAAAAHG